jgi:hypothetical protein
LLRSTVTKANSAATKTPQAAMSSRAVPRRIHSVSVGSFSSVVLALPPYRRTQSHPIRPVIDFDETCGRDHEGQPV